RENAEDRDDHDQLDQGESAVLRSLHSELQDASAPQFRRRDYSLRMSNYRPARVTHEGRSAPFLPYLTDLLAIFDRFVSVITIRRVLADVAHLGDHVPHRQEHAERQDQHHTADA